VPSLPVNSISSTPVTTPPIKSPTSAPVPTQSSKHLDYTRRSRSTAEPVTVRMASTEKPEASGNTANSEDEEEFSAKLVKLRANLRASQQKTGNSSTRYSSNDLNSRQPFVRAASASSENTVRYPN
jgi:hypothetical protein